MSAVQISPETLAQRQREEDMIGLRFQLQGGFQVLQCVSQIPDIDHSHAIVVMVFGRFQVDHRLLKAPIAHPNVQFRIMGHFAVRPASRCGKQFPGFAKLSGVKQVGRLLKRLQLRLGCITRLRRTRGVWSGEGQPASRPSFTIACGFRFRSSCIFSHVRFLP